MDNYEFTSSEIVKKQAEKSETGNCKFTKNGVNLNVLSYLLDMK